MAERYVARLATDGIVRGLVGPREAARLWDRHVLNSALLAAAVPREATVADIGSGAGLPGLVVAIARPDVRVTLVEPLLRRTTFLDEVVADLGLTNVTVRRDRADALHGETTFDVVTARAVAPLERLLGWCMPLVAPDGALLAMKGESAAEEIEAAGPVLARLGCAHPSVEVYGADLRGEHPEVEPIRVVRVTWADPARVSWPTSGSGSRRGGGARQRRDARRRPRGTGMKT
ncbi:MAG TPA: 16S rRNA (guanine(527)-N(7))-methyltransferase RsmG [Nocardioides sp.]|nr:16S rRNA (guanine(527)-N(7))-methyltransferase RsmG [Nocardioides sp.]